MRAELKRNLKKRDEEQENSWKLNDFEDFKVIGKGKFGVVKEAKEKKSGCKIALKKVNKNFALKNKLWLPLKREVEIHGRLRHPMVVRLFGVFQTERNVYLVMERVEGINLFEFLEKKGPLGLSSAKKVRAFLRIR